MLLILLGNGVVANVLLAKSKGFNSGWIVICAGWGFAVGIAVYVTGWASGAHINPAVTLGFCLAGKTALELDASLCFFTNARGNARCLSGLLNLLSSLEKTTDPTAKLLCFATHPAIRTIRWNFVAEAIGTAVLLIGVLGIINSHNQIAGGMGPYAMGILVLALVFLWEGPQVMPSIPRAI